MQTFAAPVSLELPAAPAPAPRVVSLMGLRVVGISEPETVEYVIDALHRHRGGWVCPANLDVLRQWRTSREVRELVARADLVVADGMPLVWAAKLQGTPLPERVAGSSLILSLTTAAADAGASVFLLGGNPGTADAAVAELRQRSPGIQIAGTLCPPLGFETDPLWRQRIERRLGESGADIVYVALGFPKQERLIAELRTQLPRAWFVSCGISFSFVAGEIRRAPTAVQRLGLEWLHRLIQEPRRLYRRYLLEGIPFLVRLLGHAALAHLRATTATER